MMSLKDVLQKYSDHPEFLGIDLVDVNQRGAVDDSPLHIASRKGEIEDIEVLLSNGADINLAGDLGNTPLHQAAMTGKTEAIKKLLSHGANSRLTNEFGQTALKVAELGKHKKAIEILSKRDNVR
jgi:ankyrin repeat protein